MHLKGNFAKLTRQEELKHWNNYIQDGSITSRNKLISSVTPYIIKMVRNRMYHNDDFGVVFSHVIEFLISNIDKYNPEYRFITFTNQWVRGALSNYYYNKQMVVNTMYVDNIYDSEMSTELNNAFKDEDFLTLHKIVMDMKNKKYQMVMVELLKGWDLKEISKQQNIEYNALHYRYLQALKHIKNMWSKYQ